jgi:hypothetical protein
MKVEVVIGSLENFQVAVTTESLGEGEFLKKFFLVALTNKAKDRLGSSRALIFSSDSCLYKGLLAKSKKAVQSELTIRLNLAEGAILE